MPAPTPDVDRRSATLDALLNSPFPPRRPSAEAVRLLAAEPLPAPGTEAAETQRRFSSEQLFGGRVEIEIEHGESTYRLRRTALGKLILTK